MLVSFRASGESEKSDCRGNCHRRKLWVQVVVSKKKTSSDCLTRVLSGKKKKKKSAQWLCIRNSQRMWLVLKEDQAGMESKGQSFSKNAAVRKEDVS